MYYIGGKANSDFDFDGLVARLLAAFPGSTVITNDYYADRLEHTSQLARDAGRPLDSAPIECLKRVGEEHGLQRHISVVLSPTLSFDSRIDKLGVFMVGSNDFGEPDAKPLLAAPHLRCAVPNAVLRFTYRQTWCVHGWQQRFR